MNLVAKLLLAVLLICFRSGAGAQEQEKGAQQNAQVGVGLICDSAQQVERYLTLYQGNTTPENALDVVNTESKNPHACGMAAIAFIADQQVAILNTSNGTVRVLRIKIIAAATDRGWQQVPEMIQYTALFEKTEEA